LTEHRGKGQRETIENRGNERTKNERERKKRIQREVERE